VVNSKEDEEEPSVPDKNTQEKPEKTDSIEIMSIELWNEKQK